MMKFLIPAVFVFFAFLSIAFFDGWPFSGSDSENESEDYSEQKDLNDEVPGSQMPGTTTLNKHGEPINLDTEGRTDNGEKPAAVKEEVPDGAPVSHDSSGEDHSEEPVKPSAVAALRARLQGLRTESMTDPYRLAVSEAVLADSFPTRERLALLDDLKAVNRRLVTAGARSVLPFELVEVKPNDNLTRIARRVKKKHGNNVTPAMIMHINRMTRDVVQLGRKLAVPTESISVVARKSDYRLYVLLGSSVVMDFEIGLGRDDSTPEGRFVVRGKTKNPAWTRPDKSVVPFGHEEHTIGNRWMGLDDAGGRTGYGIHGTVDESSIGKSDSDGCIRLKRLDVEALYLLVPEGASVEVRR